MTENYTEISEKYKNEAVKNQLIAADPKISAWVEASAGTGKTKVLSDRVLRLLLSGVKPERILCLTYTKAAAVEMKTRISESLSEWSVQSEEDLRESLSKLLGIGADNKEIDEYISKARTLFAVLLDTPGGVKIQTIHSFCEEVLKRFPLEAGISPYFEILTEREKNEALEQIKNGILRRSGRSDSEEARAIQYLVANLAENTFPKVMKSITEEHDKITDVLNNRKTDEILQALRKKLGVSEEDDDEQIRTDCMLKLKRNTSDLKKNIIALNNGGEKNKKKAKKLQAILDGGCSVSDFHKYIYCFLTAEGEISKNEWELGDSSAVKYDSEVLNRMKNEALLLRSLLIKHRKVRVYKSSKAFLTIAQGINTEYEEYKREKSCLDFNDLINKVRDLLTSDQAAWVLYKLDGGIDHILLDEAQDTSPRQWKIVDALSENLQFEEVGEKKACTVFAVGDCKQSIFSFQGADLQEFARMKGEFKKRGGANFKDVKMMYSFRSSQAILDSVDFIFADKKVHDGVITSDSWSNHIAVRAGEYGRVEIWPLLRMPKSEPVELEDKLLPPEENIKKESVRTKMAIKIADKIKQMVEESKGSKRPFRYKDFMVLVRHRNDFVQDFIRTCKSKNINISGADRMVLSEQIVVQDMISLAKFLLLPQDDLSLAEVLKSPLFGLTDDDLVILCCERGDDSLWERLGKNGKYEKVYESLKILLGKLDFIRPFELFNYVLVNMDGRKKFMKRMGIEAEDALDEFMNITLSYEQTQTPNLQGFISWFENDETALKREGDNNEMDAVRLMTVHHSKGLQARVVFLPDCVGVPKNSREQKLLFDKEGLMYYPLCKDDYDDVCTKVNEENGATDLEEYRRLLYVALTRAEDILFICGYTNYQNINKNSWYAICEKAMKEKCITDEDENIVNEMPELAETKIKKKYFVQQLSLEPEKWIEAIPEEENSLAKPYTPSNMENNDEEPDSVSPLEENINYYRRGSLIHKILQFLPANNSDKAQIIGEYINKNAADFSDNDKAQIKKEILELLAKEEYAPIFGADSRAEVPVFGEEGGKVISAQIDRLVVQDDKIIIVDFKTNRPAKKTLEETPKAYITQLNTYKSLIGKIYPNRHIETYILWTNEARLMRVS